jgi:hypothetical protein
MESVDLRRKADVVEISGGLSLSNSGSKAILELCQERGIADVSAAL